MARNRKFSPIFQATVTFGDDMLIADDKNGRIYGRVKGQVIYRDGSTKDRTIMVFGGALQAIQPHFVPGNTVQVAVQHDEGTVIIVGLPREKRPIAA
jgi:hypothetical protein